MKQTRNLFYLANSFSEDSGGRTQATFTRAKMLTDFSDSSFILTFNFKRDYGKIYDIVRKKRNIPLSVSFLNMYEFYAGEELYRGLETQKVIYEKDPKYSYEYIEKKNAYKVYDNGIQVQYVQLDDDGTCVYKDFFDDKKRKLKRETYDSLGNIKLVSYLDVINKKALRKIYYTGNERVYLYIDYDRVSFDTVQCITFDKNGYFYKKFTNEEEMAKFWLAELNSSYPNSIFFIEDRKLDKSVISNPYSTEEFKSVAVIHSSHLKKPYNFGAKINQFNGELLKDTSDCSAVVLLTRQQLKHVQNQFGLQPNLYHIPHVKLEQEKEFNVKKNIYKIVVLSRFVEMKRIMDILEAFKLAVEKVADVKLEIWGSGQEQEKYQEFIDENHLQNFVSIKGYTNEPRKVLYSAGLSIITSRYEGFGMTILESMASQTPVLAYNFNYGPKELIDDDINGYIVENGNVAELANQIIKAYKDKNTLKEMGKAAKEKASKFNVEIIKQEWIELIRKIENQSPKNNDRTMKQVILFSEITNIYKEKNENNVELNFTIQNELSTGTPNKNYYLYLSNYYDLEKIGNRYFELNVIENSKENSETLSGTLTISKVVYNELQEMTPKFLLGVGNADNFYFVETICSCDL